MPDQGLMLSPQSNQASTFRLRLTAALGACTLSAATMLAAGGSPTAGHRSPAPDRVAAVTRPATPVPVTLTAQVFAGQIPGALPGTLWRRARSARVMAWRLMRRFRWRPRYQFRYLRWLWERESGWNKYAYNPYSGAYGIPQALPGWKMASAGPNWRSDARTQIIWGLRYIRNHYRSPKRAWAHERAYGWY